MARQWETMEEKTIDNRLCCGQNRRKWLVRSARIENPQGLVIHIQHALKKENIRAINPIFYSIFIGFPVEMEGKCKCYKSKFLPITVRHCSIDVNEIPV